MNIDMNEINNAEYMKKMIYNHKYVKYLGGELRKNPEFIMEMARDPEFKNHWALLRYVDKSLINTEFIISYLEAIHDKGAITPNTHVTLVATLRGILPEESIFGNEELWNAIKRLGIAKDEIVKERWTIESAEKILEEMMNKIETVNVKEFMKNTNVAHRDDFDIMLEVLTRNPHLYPCLSQNLKNDEEFNEILILQKPENEEIINKYQKEHQAEEEQKRQKEEEERNQRKEERDEIKRKEKEQEQAKLIEQYEEQGENHPNLILVKQFLEVNTSKISFCRKYNVDIKDLDKAIEEVSFVYPEIAEKVEEKNKQTTAIYLKTVEEINEKLLSGEITLQQYSQEYNRGKKIDDLLRNIKDENKRKQFHTLVIKEIASEKLTMMDYVRLFSEEYDYKTVMENINEYMKKANKEISEQLKGKGKPFDNAKKQIKNLGKYSKPYKSRDFKGIKKGFTNSDGEVEMTTITEEHLEYAKKYLHLEDEYICYSTINSVLSKLIKGEITFEEIQERKNEMNKEISIESIVVNAINNGTGTEKVHEADSSIGNGKSTNTPTIDNK